MAASRRRKDGCFSKIEESADVVMQLSFCGEARQNLVFWICLDVGRLRIFRSCVGTVGLLRFVRNARDFETFLALMLGVFFPF